MWQRTESPSDRSPVVLIEDPDESFAMSDFGVVTESGYGVRACSGPDGNGGCCPLAHGERCELADVADVIVFAGDGADKTRFSPGRRRLLELVAAGHPDTPILVAVARGAVPRALPQGCIPLPWPMSVAGQLTEVARARARH